MPEIIGLVNVNIEMSTDLKINFIKYLPSIYNLSPNLFPIESLK